MKHRNTKADEEQSNNFQKISKVVMNAVNVALKFAALSGKMSLSLILNDTGTCLLLKSIFYCMMTRGKYEH